MLCYLLGNKEDILYTCSKEDLQLGVHHVWSFRQMCVTRTQYVAYIDVVVRLNMVVKNSRFITLLAGIFVRLDLSMSSSSAVRELCMYKPPHFHLHHQLLAQSCNEHAPCACALPLNVHNTTHLATTAVILCFFLNNSLLHHLLLSN